jgi:hypothetical protein
MASTPSFSVSPEPLSGPIDLFLPIIANLFLVILVLMAKGSPELAHCICGMLGSQLNTVSTESEMSRPLIFPITFTSFYILVELSPALTLIS